MRQIMGGGSMGDSVGDSLGGNSAITNNLGSLPGLWTQQAIQFGSFIESGRVDTVATNTSAR